jgi:hypothetical protein
VSELKIDLNLHLYIISVLWSCTNQANQNKNLNTNSEISKKKIIPDANVNISQIFNHKKILGEDFYIVLKLLVAASDNRLSNNPDGGLYSLCLSFNLQ